MTRLGAHGSQKVVHYFSAHFCLVKTPSIAIWGKQNRGGPYEFELEFEFPDPADRLAYGSSHALLFTYNLYDTLWVHVAMYASQEHG